MIWNKLARIPHIYRTAGAFGLAGRVTAVPPLSLLCYVAGSVVMGATALRLPSVLDRMVRNYQVTRARSDDIAEMVAHGAEVERAFQRRVFNTYLDGGAAGIVIRRNGRLVGYNWVFHDRYELQVGSPQRKVDLLMPPGHVFFGSGYIVPEFRLQGVFPLMLQASASAFGPALGLWSSSHIWNDISLRSHQRLGFQKLFEIRCIEVLGREQYLHNRTGGRWHRIAGGAMELPLLLPGAAASPAPPPHAPSSRAQGTA